MIFMMRIFKRIYEPPATCAMWMAWNVPMLHWLAKALFDFAMGQKGKRIK